MAVIARSISEINTRYEHYLSSWHYPGCVYETRRQHTRFSRLLCAVNSISAADVSLNVSIRNGTSV